MKYEPSNPIFIDEIIALLVKKVEKLLKVNKNAP